MTRSPNCGKYIVHDMCFFVTPSCSPRRFVTCFAVYGAALAGTIRRRRRLYRSPLHTPPASPISLAAPYGYAWWAPLPGGAQRPARTGGLEPCVCAQVPAGHEHIARQRRRMRARAPARAHSRAKPCVLPTAIAAPFQYKYRHHSPTQSPCVLFNISHEGVRWSRDRVREKYILWM